MRIGVIVSVRNTRKKVVQNKQLKIYPLIRVVETVLDCLVFGVGKVIVRQKDAGKQTKLVKVANNDLLMKASPRRISELDRDCREELLVWVEECV